MKLFFRLIALMGAAVISGAVLSSCDDDESYTKLLSAESKAVNLFLSDHKVLGSVPADTIFQVGEDAPYYQIDDEGKIFMQVLDAGSGPKAIDKQLVYFRYTRYNLRNYVSGQELPALDSNNDASTGQFYSRYFRYNDYTLPSTSQQGTGIQSPLKFLPLNCRVNLIIKAELGPTSETSYVQPMLYDIRYFPSKL